MGDDINIVDMLEELNLRLIEAETDIEVLKTTPPPADWVHSVTYLVDRYMTRKTALGIATTLVAMYAIFQGVPGV
jgi:hypothetical protein